MAGSKYATFQMEGALHLSFHLIRETRRRSHKDTPFDTSIYRGGSTNVMTGGVMLGRGGSKPSPKVMIPTIPSPRTPAKKNISPSFKKSPGRGADSDNWRSRARV